MDRNTRQKCAIDTSLTLDSIRQVADLVAWQRSRRQGPIHSSAPSRRQFYLEIQVYFRNDETTKHIISNLPVSTGSLLPFVILLLAR